MGPCLWFLAEPAHCSELSSAWDLTRADPVSPQSTLAVWVKWPTHPSAPDLAGNKRQFGSVCHQDPR